MLDRDRAAIAALSPLGSPRNVMRGVEPSNAQEMAARGLAMLDAMPSNDYVAAAAICRRIMSVMRSHPDAQRAAEFGIRSLAVISNETFDAVRLTRAVLMNYTASDPLELLSLGLAIFDDLKYAYNLNQLGPIYIRELAPSVTHFCFEHTLRHTMETVPWEKAYKVYQGILEDLHDSLHASSAGLLSA